MIIVGVVIVGILICALVIFSLYTSTNSTDDFII